MIPRMPWDTSWGARRGPGGVLGTNICVPRRVGAIAIHKQRAIPGATANKQHCEEACVKYQ